VPPPEDRHQDGDEAPSQRKQLQLSHLRPPSPGAPRTPKCGRGCRSRAVCVLGWVAAPAARVSREPCLPAPRHQDPSGTSG
jgi:hypothetical protein